MKDKNAHEDQGGVQVFVVVVSFSLGPVVELNAGAADLPKEIRRER